MMNKLGQSEVIAGVRSKAVRAQTGNGWKEWLAILDKAGARRMPHREIVDYLYEKHKVPGWWAQMVSVGYEQARGLRKKHQKPGGYEIGVGRVLPMGVAAAFKAWKDEKLRRRWLPDAKGAFTIRKAMLNKSMRITWVDGKTSLSVYFLAKGTGKCQVVVQHSKLPNARTAASKKTYWAQAFERLRTTLEK